VSPPRQAGEGALNRQERSRLAPSGGASRGRQNLNPGSRQKEKFDKGQKPRSQPGIKVKHREMKPRTTLPQLMRAGELDFARDGLE
jgi:hypothetical protein